MTAIFSISSDNADLDINDSPYNRQVLCAVSTQWKYLENTIFFPVETRETLMIWRHHGLRYLWLCVRRGELLTPPRTMDSSPFLSCKVTLWSQKTQSIRSVLLSIIFLLLLPPPFLFSSFSSFFSSACSCCCYYSSSLQDNWSTRKPFKDFIARIVQPFSLLPLASFFHFLLLLIPPLFD